MLFKKLIFICVIVCMDIVFVQDPSGRQYRRYGIHNGNLVRTVFGNYGVVAQPSNSGPRGAWIHDNNGYIGDVSIMVGAEVSIGDSVTFHSVVVCPVSRPVLGGMEESPTTGALWGFEPVSGYFNESQEYVAMSTNPNSWPTYWPDKPLDWGKEWNGFYGKDVQLIQQESYFVMNDNNDEEFNNENNNVHNVAFKPDSTNSSLNGLGLEVKVRGMQWGQFMAQDVLFWLYEVTNKSTTDYSKVAFGELVGTYVGITSTEDKGEYDDDWSFFDVNRDLTYTGDFDNDCSRNPNWVGEVGMVGYAFLESPGNPFDGIDNDGDSIEFGSAPLFEETDFDSLIISVGDIVVLIDDEYNRTLRTISESDTELQTRGGIIQFIPGESYLMEGNIWEDESGKEWVNPNAYDGIDNDLDGLIDENYYIHFRQRRVDQVGTVLFDIENPRAYKNYVTGSGLDNLMIDEMRDNGMDDDNDWDIEFDDVGTDGVADTDDMGEGDGVPTAGEPNYDQTDPDESDQIGLTSFDYFTPAGDFPHKDDEALWDKLAPGFFDVPSSIVDGEPIAGEDGDFIFGSGYFPLKAGQTERFSIALIYGEDKDDLLKNKEIVQNIYDQDYRFPPPPTKPTLTAVSGDGKVTLYWDRKAEEDMDPILKKLDFQGYKIYKATDSNFNDVRNVTNADGVVEGYQPLAQFDLADTVSGYFYPNEELFQDAQGFTYNLGSNTGLEHHYVDEDVLNGRTYYYALVAYDEGDPEQLFPAENSKFIQVLPSGEVLTDQNTAVVIPSSFAAGYDLDTTIVVKQGENTVATGFIAVDIVDETQLTGHEYLVEFLDTSTDSIDNDNDSILDMNDLDEYPPVTTMYSVLDLTGIEEIIQPEDTLPVYLSHQHIYPESFYLINSVGLEIPTLDYGINFEKGKIWSSSPGSLGSALLTAAYQYHPIYQSPYIQGSPWINERLDTQVFDGIRLKFANDWNINIDTTYWKTELFDADVYGFSVGVQNADWLNPVVYAKKIPNDYIVIFSDSIGFGQALVTGVFPLSEEGGTETNFIVWDIIHSRNVPFIFVDTSRPNVIDGGDFIYFYEKDENNIDHFSWNITFFEETIGEPEEFDFGFGDTLFIMTSKPFRNKDEYYFTTTVPKINDEWVADQMNDIKVVPNPYIAATNFESPLPPGITSGRGERKVEFQNLPADSKVKIYTARGQHIRTLVHEGSIHSGTVTWDLKTKENLDTAFGVYFYVVESEYGGKKGKLALIK